MIAAADDDDRRATLARWLRPDGSIVAADEPLCELETDQATAVLAAPTAGVLRHLAREGDTVSAGDEVTRIDPLP